MTGTLRSLGMMNPALRGKNIADIAAYVRGQALAKRNPCRQPILPHKAVGDSSIVITN